MDIYLNAVSDSVSVRLNRAQTTQVPFVFSTSQLIECIRVRLEIQIILNNIQKVLNFFGWNKYFLVQR